MIVGTAGHIDHGKSALIKALTGQDTDRLKEEKERGISIDLGFAHLDLDDGTRVGIVDVPGHERFIRNMLAGAHGIDLALLVDVYHEFSQPQQMLRKIRETLKPDGRLVLLEYRAEEEDEPLEHGVAGGEFLGVDPEAQVGKHCLELIENSRMHIVATSMHNPTFCRFERNIITFINWECIYVCSNRYRRFQ